MDASVTDSNRRVRTRTHGGVAGVRGRPRPLCRSTAPFYGMTRIGLVLFRVIVQVLPQPSFDFGLAHYFALGVVGNLVTVDLAQTEITRFRMSEIKATHARSGPHRKRLRDLNSCIRPDIEQMPECALLCVIRARGVTRCRPDATIFFLNKIFVAQTFRTTIAPFIPYAFVEALGEGLRQAI